MNRVLTAIVFMIAFTISGFCWGERYDRARRIDPTISGVIYVEGGSPPPYINVVRLMEVQLWRWTGSEWVWEGNDLTDDNGHFFFPIGVVDCPAGGLHKVKAIAMCCGYDGEFTYPNDKGFYNINIDCTEDITGLEFVYNYKFY